MPATVRPVLGLAAAAVAAATAMVVVTLAGSTGPTVIMLLVVVMLLVVLHSALTVRLIRHAFRRDEARGRMITRISAAAQLEHRRLAHDLRDGVLQDLAGVGYVLGSAPDGLATDPELPRRLAEIVQRDILTLRRVLVDVQPPDLSPGAFAAAIGDLTTVLRMNGVVCVVRVPDRVNVSGEVALLLYRAARETLRNVDRHAHAGRVEVTVVLAEAVTLTVADDGVGFDPAEVAAGDPPGRADGDGRLPGGLGLLRAAVADCGGAVTVTGGVGAGTTVTVTVPLRSGG